MRLWEASVCSFGVGVWVAWWYHGTYNQANTGTGQWFQHWLKPQSILQPSWESMELPDSLSATEDEGNMVLRYLTIFSGKFTYVTGVEKQTNSFPLPSSWHQKLNLCIVRYSSTFRRKQVSSLGCTRGLLHVGVCIWPILCYFHW